MAKLSMWGLLDAAVPIVHVGDAVEVEFSPLLPSPGGITVPQSELVLLLNSLVATGKQWDAITIYLFTDALTPTPTTPLADFVAAGATFTGSAGQLLVWLAAQNAPGNNGTIPTQTLQFIATAVATPEVIRGWFAQHA